MMVPASEDVIIISGVLSFGGVVIVLPEIPGAVVSVVVLSVVELSSVVVSSSEVVVVEDELSLDEEPPSSLVEHEMIVKLKRSRERIMKKYLIRFPNWLV